MGTPFSSVLFLSITLKPFTFILSSSVEFRAVYVYIFFNIILNISFNLRETRLTDFSNSWNITLASVAVGFGLNFSPVGPFLAVTFISFLSASIWFITPGSPETFPWSHWITESMLAPLRFFTPTTSLALKNSTCSGFSNFVLSIKVIPDAAIATVSSILCLKSLK